MINLHIAIYALNPAIVTILDDVAYDANKQVVAYDMTQAEAKLAELKAQAQADAQAAISAKASALAKLATLGLTDVEIKALTGN
jgi:hypothetical protein